MMYKKQLVSLAVGAALLAAAAPVLAAAPDGAGPWADGVVSSLQGLRKDGSAVLAERSNPSAAVGVAENDTVGSHFFSLGFGGTITLSFDNPVESGVIVVEATNAPYANETASVEMSANGTTWVPAGNVTFDGTVSIPERLSCAKYVRITDVSNKADHDATADGYDLDGVQALGTQCEVPQVPEFGLVTGLLALAGSAGSYIFAKKRTLV